MVKCVSRCVERILVVKCISMGICLTTQCLVIFFYTTPSLPCVISAIAYGTWFEYFVEQYSSIWNLYCGRVGGGASRDI